MPNPEMKYGTDQQSECPQSVPILCTWSYVRSTDATCIMQISDLPPYQAARATSAQTSFSLVGGQQRVHSSFYSAAQNHGVHGAFAAFTSSAAYR